MRGHGPATVARDLLSDGLRQRRGALRFSTDGTAGHSVRGDEPVKLAITIVASAMLYVGCAAAPTANAPVQVSATAQGVLGTPLPTLTLSPTPTTAKVTKAPKDVLLVLNDVPAGFRLSTDAERRSLGLHKATTPTLALEQSKLQTMGWISGWHRVFAKDGFGVQLINDAVSLYASADGAKLGLAENVRGTTTATPPGVQISLGGAALGDEALAYQIDSASGGNQFTTLVIYCRFGNASNTGCREWHARTRRPFPSNHARAEAARE